MAHLGRDRHPHGPTSCCWWSRPPRWPRAASSREISVAAEDSLRIVPVVIETAPISVGLKYDLAGVQHVSFVDRPFEDGMADLAGGPDRDR